MAKRNRKKLTVKGAHLGMKHEKHSKHSKKRSKRSERKR